MKGSEYAPDTDSENAARPETCDKLFVTLRLVISLSPAALDKMQTQIRACNSLVSNLRTLSITFKDSLLGKRLELAIDRYDHAIRPKATT